MLGIRAVAPAALVFMLPALAPAQTVENPPSFSAEKVAKIAGIPAKGGNYTIQSPVQSDGIT